MPKNPEFNLSEWQAIHQALNDNRHQIVERELTELLRERWEAMDPTDRPAMPHTWEDVKQRPSLALDLEMAEEYSAWESLLNIELKIQQLW